MGSLGNKPAARRRYGRRGAFIIDPLACSFPSNLFLNLQNNPPVRAQLPTVAWFRVAAVGEIETTAGGWRRKLTLDGPDFNPYKFVDAVGAPAGNQSCYCTIVDGVTGVYEVTVEEGQ